MSVDEPYEKLRVALGLQTRHLDSVIHALRDRDEEPLRVTLLMIQAFGVTANSVLRLTATRDMAIRDCFGMARSGFELATNICYIEASGVEAARRAQDHALL
jgi:hypothetical protein